MIAEAAHALWKRQNDQNPPEVPAIDFPAWAYGIFFVDFIILMFVFLILNYTLQKLFPILAIVEDEKPPVYEPLSSDLLDESNTDPDVNKNNGRGAFANGPVTSSFRGTWRLLKSTGGFRALFRGLPCYAVQSLLRSIIVGFFLALPFGTYFSVVGDLVASLALVQLSTAWVHIIMTPHSALQFWKRTLPFKHTFTATWRPTVLFWFSTQLIRALYIPVRYAFDVDNKYSEVPKQSDAWRGLAAIVLIILIQIVVIIPAYVILVRVQASLLPEDTETIVPFDRSFTGQIEPAVVGGRGYATIRDAYVSFTRPAWHRVIKFYVKLTAIIIASTVVIGVILIPQVYLMQLEAPVNGGA